MTTRIGILTFLFLFSFKTHGEPIRALVAGTHNVSLTAPEGITVPLTYISSSLIQIEGDARFLRGIQMELTAPQRYLSYRGSLAVALYGDLNRIPGTGIVDLECRRLGFDVLPAKIQPIYQIPLKAEHGLRTSPYVTVLTGVLSLSSFPLLFRLMPVIREITDEVERMVFHLNVKPILSDEGALRINFRYPANSQNQPITVLLDGEVITNPEEERLLREGEHHLAVLSENYRNQSSRFVVERARVLDLSVELRDPTPLLIFEYPEETKVYLDNIFLPNPRSPLPVKPGTHDIRYKVGKYTVIRSLIEKKKKNYRLSLSVDVNITESE
jgi:hypothetical protein